MRLTLLTRNFNATAESHNKSEYRFELGGRFSVRNESLGFLIVRIYTICRSFKLLRFLQKGAQGAQNETTMSTRLLQSDYYDNENKISMSVMTAFASM